MVCSIYSGPGCVAPTIQHHGSEQQAGRLRSHTNTLIFVWTRNSAKSMGVSKVHSSQLMNLQGSPVLPAGLPAEFWAMGQPLPNIRFGPQISSSRQNLATKTRVRSKMWTPRPLCLWPSLRGCWVMWSHTLLPSCFSQSEGP